MEWLCHNANGKQHHLEYTATFRSLSLQDCVYGCGAARLYALTPLIMGFPRFPGYSLAIWACLLCGSIRPQGTRASALEHHEQFFKNDSGRWLWNEEERLRERYKAFNVPALNHAAADSLDSRHCISMMKLAEGGCNKVFRLVMDNGTCAIARIPNLNAGPPFYTTASNVATMEFVGFGSICER